MVALRGSTGAIVWHFQTVHHDLVVVAAGGHYLFHHVIDDNLGDTLVAFALPAD
ncbi:MAG: hypothetical protein MJE66_01980 [Proteobacteria bacterium]|nr:hypothetical protein [Pseudomonadota bacterium]